MHIITGSRIFDGRCFNPEIEAIAVDGYKITAIGKKSELLDRAGSSSQIDDFGDAIIIPGITDAHIHLLEYGRSLEVIQCETKTKHACLEVVRNAAHNTEEGKWLFGHGWNQNVWDDGMPALSDLDAACPRNPILLTHKSLHSVWVNTPVLELAGINSETEHPTGGVIGRDASGSLTGILYENAAQLVYKFLPRPDKTEIKRLLQKAQDSLLSLGITAVHDFDIWAVFEALRELEDEHKLLLRVVKNIPYENLAEAAAVPSKNGYHSSRISKGWLKLFSDGALGPQTAALFQPYLGTDNFGKLLLEEKEIIEIGLRAAQVSIPLAIHAIGDRANHVCLNAFEQLQKSTQQLHHRPRIEHAQLVNAEDFIRFHTLGVIASMQPTHAVSDQPTATKYWGDRCATAYAWQRMLDNKVELVFGSDAPVEDPNPVKGIRAAVWRRTQQYHAGWYPHECLMMEQTLRAFTSKPAEISGHAREYGSIHPGRKVSLSVFSPSAFEFDSEVQKPSAVMIDGNWIFMN